MIYSDQYVIGSAQRDLLRQLLRAKVRLVEPGPFQLTEAGAHCMGLLALCESDQINAVVYGLEHKGAFDTFPTLHVERVEDYSGEWSGFIPRAKSLLECLNGSGTADCDPTVVDVHIIQDHVRWRSVESGAVNLITTDVGLQFTLSNGAALLVIAAESEAGLLHTVYTTNHQEVVQWLSNSAVRRTWMVIDSPDCPVVLEAASRTTLPV